MTQINGPVGSGGGVSMDTSRLATKENLDAAGQRFESIFIGMMLKSMRSAKLADGLFETKALEQFRDMQDQKLSENMAAHTPIGIGKAMTEFLSKSAKLTTAETNAPSKPGAPGEGSVS